MGERGLILPLALDEHIAQETCRFATSNGDQVSISDIDFTVRVKSSCGKWNGYDTGFITLCADISVQD